MSDMAITMEQLERRMKQIMIEVDERAANSIDKARDRAVFAKMLQGNGISSGEEEDDDEEEEEKKAEEGEEPAPKDCSDNISNKKLPAAPRARALRMDLASCYIPDHDEDGHFVHPKSGFAGVADGVGGYREYGVDAAAFARALMTHARAGANPPVKRGRITAQVTPYNLLQRAYMKAARARTQRGSTAVIVSLHGSSKTLRWACIGDSGFAVLRAGKMVHRSKAQQSCFNCPFQLCTFGGNRLADADVGEAPVAEGDVVVLGTDGLFDNVFDVELQRGVEKGRELGLSPQKMADKIAAAARKMAGNRRAPSPFSVESARSVQDGRKRHYGGKFDDITVVVGYIVSKES
ncbi:hypothetical protein PR202_gb09148 [Eleusine coracana subsp. coracana]|uniref:Protein phosphatase n=1 Tax=Eleusine coracana subsp. coracana TaxID=191504 RepID=A0AAV5EG75_ELECO|nr:hypothetical protein PR202_gb09148 [Eleusine coracana subsp. coracana]